MDSAERVMASVVADCKNAVEWVVDGELFVRKSGVGMLPIEPAASVSDSSAYVAGTWDTSGGCGDVIP